MTPALLVGILATSALGSVHCLAMCGPLVAIHGGARSMQLAITHSLGRLTTYVVLGGIAGTLGGALDLAGHLANVQRAATLVSGIAIVLWGLWTLGHRTPARVTSGNRTLFADSLRQIRTRRPGRRAWLAGTLTGLLPCGWLWAFVVTAGGTGNAARGALVMVAFWLGTLPAMVGLLPLAGPMLARIRTRLPTLTAIGLIVIGLGTLALRFRDAGETQVSAPHCCQHETTR